MQDKDLDRLFSDKLGNLEVEPSREVWKSIAANVQNKRPLGIYLSIAATVLVLITVGIHFVMNREVTHPKQQVAQQKPQIDQSSPVKQQTEGEIDRTDEKRSVVQGLNNLQDVAAAVKRKPRLVKRFIKPIEYEPVKNVSEPVTMGEQLAQLPVTTTEIRHTVPDRTVPLIEKIEEPEPVIMLNAASAQSKEQARTLAAAPAKKHKIRGIGDLLNAVVSKIDKRKDKLIEFSDKDEDEPNVTGLNLGFIKIKKQD